MAEKSEIYSTGRRKTSVARVHLLSPGKGKFLINKKSIEEYFSGQGRCKFDVTKPLQLTHSLNNYDIYVNVSGGGITGQTEAIRHGISRALAQINPEFNKTLRQEELLKRDPRMVERKKYGQAKARKRFQWTKR